jgi:thiol-disulfide isomerase/thioredoxin
MLALTTAASTMTSQTLPTRPILEEADSTVARLQTAIYTATVIHTDVTGEVDTSSGRVVLKRNPLEGEVGFKARIEGEGFTVAYDGERTLSLNEGERRVTQQEPTSTFAALLRGNVIGSFVDRIFRRRSPFSAMDSVATYEGVVEIAGTPCHSISLSYPDGEEMKNIRSRWCFGVEDGFPRRYEFAGEFLQQPYADEITFSDVQLNPPLADALFTIAVPEGYAKDTLKPWKKPDLLAIGTPAPTWKLATVAGGERTLEELRGKVVVLDFWYLSCAPCQLSMPHLSELQKRFDKDSVVVLGVNTHDAKDKVAELFAKKGFVYEPLLDGR